MPGACDLAEWNVPHAPHEHRSLLNQIDGEGKKGLAGLAGKPRKSAKAIRTIGMRGEMILHPGGIVLSPGDIHGYG